MGQEEDLARIATALERLADATLLQTLEVAVAAGELTGDRKELSKRVFARLLAAD